MKLRLLAAVAVLAMVAAFGGLFGGNVAEAACPSALNGGCAQDHTWGVTVVPTTSGAPTDTTVNLTLGTNSAASAPFPTAFFNEATAMYTGITPTAWTAAGTGAQVGQINFSIQSNVDPTLVGSKNINTGLTTTVNGVLPGQPPRCGGTGTLALGSPTLINAVVYSAVKNITSSPVPGTVSSGADSNHPPYTLDEEPDFAAGGVPMGVTHNLDWYAPLITSLGLVDSFVPARGYAIAKTTPASQTTVSFLTIGPVNAAGMYLSVTVLGNPIAVFNPASQAISTCPPFSSSVLTQGTTTAHNWNCGNDYFGTPISTSWPPPNPACTGGTNGVSGAGQTVTGVAASVHDYQIALSSGLNLDGDATGGGVPLWDQWDNCPVDANTTQSDAKSNGIGDACKTGGAVWTNSTAAAEAAAQITCNGIAQTVGAFNFTVLDATPNQGPAFAKCQDADQDGVLNAVDNCALAFNPTQVDTLKDGIGDACRPNMAGDPAVTTNVPGTGVGYPTEYAAQDLCGQEFTVGGAMNTAYCVANGIGAVPGGAAFRDSSVDRTPDFMASFTKPSGAVVPCQQDHVSDTNHDGYSDAKEGTPPGASCPAGPDANHNLYPPGGGIPVGPLNPTAIGACAGRNFGGTAAQNLAAKIARADVDGSGVVNIFDLTAIAGVYGQSGFGLDPTDKRNEMDVSTNGVISIFDLTATAAQYGKTVPPC